MVYDEQKLEGGNVTGVVRVGNTVHRNMNTWSSSVHMLLNFLETKHIDFTPRFLGIDDKGREILTYIEGEVANYPLPPYMWSDESLITIAKMQHDFHNASAEYIVNCDNRKWQFSYPDNNKHEVICHNDIAPYNVVFSNEKPIGIIDFDTCGPGPRIWDIAYTLYTFVPLSLAAPEDGATITYDTKKHALERKRRIRLFCNAYGIETSHELLHTVELRLINMCDILTQKSAQGEATFQKLIEEGHLDYYKNEIQFFKEHYKEWL